MRALTAKEKNAVVYYYPLHFHFSAMAILTKAAVVVRFRAIYPYFLLW